MNASCNVSIVNTTCPTTKASSPLAPWYANSFNVVMVVLYISVIVAALLGNILVCIAVYINPNLRQNAASYFIVSLAASDIGTASFAMTFDVESFTTMYRRWYHGEILCIIWTTAYLITAPSSMWNLFVMSVDRYNTLKNPWNRFKEKHSMTTRRAIITIAILWTYCLGYALLPVAIWTLRPYSTSVKNNYCRFNISANYSTAGSFLNFYLPMFAMCCIYYKVYRIAHAHRKTPLALETHFHKVSTNDSQTAASALFNGDSLSPPSNDQLPSFDGSATENKRDNANTTVGLENVSFFLEENSGSDNRDSTCVRNVSLSVKMQTEPKKGVQNEEKNHDKIQELKNDMPTASGDFDSALKATDPHSSEKKELSTMTSNSNDKKCLEQPKKRHIQQHDSNCDTKKCENEKDVFAESNTKSKSLAKSMLSSKPVSPGGGHLSRNQTHAKQSGLKESYNNVLNEKIIETPTTQSTDNKQNPADQPKMMSRLIKSSSDYSLNKEGGRLFPLEKKLKHKSSYQSEEDACSLQKFNKKSDDDATLCVQDKRGKVNDTFTYSNKRKLRQFAMNTKAARTISIIVGAFLICWMPYTTMSVSFNICGPPCYRLPNLQRWGDVLLWMGYLNSALNPFLFSYQNIQFRKSYRQIGLFLWHWLNICKRHSP